MSEQKPKPQVSPDGYTYWDGDNWVRMPGPVCEWDGTAWQVKPDGVESIWDGSTWQVKPSPDAKWNGTTWLPKPPQRSYWDGNQWQSGIKPAWLVAAIIILVVLLAAGGLLIFLRSKSASEATQQADAAPAIVQQILTELDPQIPGPICGPIKEAGAGVENCMNTYMVTLGTKLNQKTGLTVTKYSSKDYLSPGGGSETLYTVEDKSGAQACYRVTVNTLSSPPKYYTKADPVPCSQMDPFVLNDKEHFAS